MLSRIESLSLDVSNIIIYTNSAILQNVLNKKLKERFNIDRNMTKYADSSATLKIAKDESIMPPFGGGIWMLDVKCDNINIKELGKALNQVSLAAVNVYWVENYSLFKKMLGLEVVKRQGVFCFSMYTGRLEPEDISYIHEAMLPEEKRLPKELINYLKKNYTYDVKSVCALFDAVLQGEEVKTTKNIIDLVGMGGNTVDSFTMKLLTSNPKTEKGLKKSVETCLNLLEDLAFTYEHRQIKNYMGKTIEAILQMKELQIMGKYTAVLDEIPEGFNEEKIRRLRRYQSAILEDINIARVLKLKLVYNRFSSFDSKTDLLRIIYTFLSEIMLSNKDNPDSKEFVGKRRRRKF